MQTVFKAVFWNVRNVLCLCEVLTFLQRSKNGGGPGTTKHREEADVRGINYIVSFHAIVKENTYLHFQNSVMIKVFAVEAYNHSIVCLIWIGIWILTLLSVFLFACLLCPLRVA